MSTEKRPSVLSLAIRDVNALYLSYMWFLKHGGLFIPTDKIYTMGEEVLMSLVLPESDDKFPVRGTVVWISPKSNHQKKQGIGVGFVDNQASSIVSQKIMSLVKNITSSRGTHTL
jgi:type IV pilus assembly protein PilZ